MMPKSAAKSPVLIPQPHGGALLSGGKRGGTPGTGRPPSALRERLRGSFEDRIQILEEIADGEITLRLTQKCEHCGKEPSQPAPTVEEVLKIVPPITDRLRALDLMAKYGLGTTKELTIEHVRERLSGTIAVIQRSLPPEQANRILEQLREVWK